jgi:hypothetical protein
MSSPTQRTLAECRKRGWTVQVVERYNPHARVRVDLFGVIDLVAIKPPRMSSSGAVERGQIIAIQACAGSSHSARLAKILAEPRAKQWVEAGGLLELWSWSKRGARGKAKRWALRVDSVTVERFKQPGSDSAALQTQLACTSNPIASGKAAA